MFGTSQSRGDETKMRVFVTFFRGLLPRELQGRWRGAVFRLVLMGLMQR